MASLIVESLLIDARRELVAKGERQPVEALAKMLPSLIDEATALRMLAAEIEKESTEVAHERRTKAAAKARAGMMHVPSVGAGLVAKGDQAHVDRVEALAKAAQMEQTLPALRKRLADANAARQQALHELSSRQMPSPIERQQLEDAVTAKDAAAKDADTELRHTEALIRKLRA